MKRNLTPFIAGGVLLALMAWYFIYEQKIKPENEASEEKSKQLSQLEAGAIQEVTIEKAGTDKLKPPVLKLKKTGSEWSLLEPVQDKADQGAVSALVTGVLNVKSERTVEDKADDLAKYGLTAPQLKITLRKDQNNQVEIWVGNDTPVGASVFATLKDSTKVYRVPVSLKTSADKDVKALRHKNIHDYSRPEFAELEVTNAKGSYVLKKTEGDKWLLARENLPADHNEAGKLISAVSDLRATDFPDEDPKDLSKYGLTKPTAKVAVTLNAKDKPRLTLLLGKSAGKFYVKRDDKKTIYEVDKEVAEKFEKPGTELRSLALAQFNRFDVNRVKIERGKEVLELLKEGSDWTMPTEPQTKIDSNKVDALLTSIQDGKIAKYTTEKKGALGLTTPQTTVRLFEKKDNAESEKVTLKFAKPSQKQVAAERSGLDMPFFITEDEFNKINQTKQSFIKVEEPKKEKTDDKKS